MSKKFYQVQWEEALTDLNELSQNITQVIESEKLPPGKGKGPSEADLFHIYAQIYLKYIDIYKKLEDCYDQTVHPQKRLLLRELLDNTMVGMCETKKRMIELNNFSEASLQSDMVNLDELIMDFKVTPDALEVPIPRYARELDLKRLQERDQLLDNLLIEYTQTAKPEIEQLEDKSLVQTIEEALVIIQRNQRGLQGIMRCNRAILLKKNELKQEQQEELKRRSNNTEQEDQAFEDNATVIFKKYWRGFLAREEVKKLREKEMVFLGMERLQDSIKQQNSLFQQAKDQREKIKLNQTENQMEYELALEQLKVLVKENEEPTIREAMLNERKDWLLEKLKELEFSSVPVYPQGFQDRFKELDQKAQAELQNKEDPKQGKKGKDAGKGKQGKPSDLEIFEKTHQKIGPSDSILSLQKQMEIYSKDWGEKDEQNNFQQQYITEMAKQTIKPDVMNDIEGIVDKMMEITIQNTALRYAIKIKKPKKKPKAKKPPQPRKIVVPGGSFTKGKEPAVLMMHLVEAGAAQKLEPARMTDLIGEINVLGALMERQNKFIPDQQFYFTRDPSYAQLRQAITEQVGIPLGSPFAKEKLDKNFFFLFYGPPSTGKTLAIRALAYECNALIIDLSPMSLERQGQVTDKKSFEGYLNAAFQVAQFYQPAIIMVDEFEQVFQGKQQKGVVYNSLYGKMQQAFMDFKKKQFFEPNDRVAVICCTNRPYEGNVQDFQTYFQKQFYFPPPDYGTRILLIKQFFSDLNVQVPEEFPLSAFAALTESYPGGSIKNAIDRVLIPRRIQRNPLVIQEFIDPLSYNYNVLKEDYIKYGTFTDEVMGFKEKRDQIRQNEENQQKGSKKPSQQ